MKNIKISYYFSFAKYLNKYYEYEDNTKDGDIYKNILTNRLMTEEEIFNEWLNK